MSRHDYDVLIATDFRYPGGTTASIRQEVEVQARMGLRTGLIHMHAPYLAAAPWAEQIRTLLFEGLADVVSERQSVTARLLVLRHPRVFENASWTLAARAEHVLMVANQVPRDEATDRPYYDVATIQERLLAELGEAPPWAPIGPTVRDALSAASCSKPELTPTDWHNVINVNAWAPRRPRRFRKPGVIGRHSRDDIRKWPEDPAVLLGAYPDSRHRRVRILGGCAAVEKLLGKKPRHWDVFPFGSIAPEAFLAGLDACVYFHHSGMREAFGRTVLEALASGLPVVTHRYLERLFSDVCIYADPRDAPIVVDDLLRDPPSDCNRAGIELVRECYDWEAHRRRLGQYLRPSLPVIRRPRTRTRRVLFVSSNGGGLGHLTRLLAVARRLPDEIEPLFLTLSTGLAAVRKFGFWVDFVPSPESSELTHAQWQHYLCDRMVVALRTFRPEALVFDGTFAYKGLLEAMAQFPEVRKIWCRRAMWKPVPPDRARQSLRQVAAFDVVIEPGEYAVEADRGATTKQRHLVRELAPIVLLDEHELLPRDEARMELGIAPDAVAVLLNPGAGNINSVDSIVLAVLDLARSRPDVHVVAAQSIISGRDLGIDSERVTVLETYPLGRLVRAFDFCVAAPGYNSFHELLAFAVPTVFVPNQQTSLDDQSARADWAQRQGVSLASRAEASDQLHRVLEELLDPAVRRSLRDCCARLPRCDGAKQAAEEIWGSIAGDSDQRMAKIGAQVRNELLVQYPSVAWERTLKRAQQVGADGLRPAALGKTVRSLGTRGVKWLRRSPGKCSAGRDSSEARVLVVVWASLTDDSAVQELVDRVMCYGRRPVVLVAPDDLRPLSRLGLTVEVLSDHLPGKDPDRLDLAAYSARKIRCLVAAYRCGPVVFWGDVEATRQLTALISLGA